MEKNISFRFYQVSRPKKSDPLFVDALREIAKIKKKIDREREIRADVFVRLEELDDDGPDSIVGEIIRVQDRGPSGVGGEMFPIPGNSTCGITIAAAVFRSKRFLSAPVVRHAHAPPASIVEQGRHGGGRIGFAEEPAHIPGVDQPGDVLDFIGDSSD